jgi:hypothetical protein
MDRFRTVALPLLSLIVIGAAVAALRASDRVAVYARIDKVVLTPDSAMPQTVQVFGVFSLAKANDPNAYEPPARGYLYFTLAGDEALVRREWADLKSVAGTRQIVAFGSRYDFRARLRAEKDPPASPDAYKTGTGVTKVNGQTDYPPVKGLVDFKD